MVKPLLLALQFLTRIPLPSLQQVEPRDVGRSLLYYPLVGLLIGGALVGLEQLIHGSGAQLQASLLLTVWVAITGALHIDGLADSADAWLGGHGDPQRTLEIMKDPRSGPIGVTVVVVLLLVKFAALGELLHQQTWHALLLAPVLGRGAVIGLFLTTPYVRQGGLGSHLASYLPRGAGWVMLLVVALLTILLFRWQGVHALLAVAIVTWLLRRLMVQRIQGTTGDTAGALVEVIETTVLLAFAL